MLLALSRLCAHCGNPIPTQIHSQFCCNGCDTVFHWSQGHDFQKYYELKSKGSSLRKPQSIADSNRIRDEYTFLDESAPLERYAFTDTQGRWMEFYLEGVHCVACVWLTEKVSQIVPGVNHLRLNLGNSIATVCLSREGSFAAVATVLEEMGYRPHPIPRENTANTHALARKEDRKLLIRVGVAGACAGNIMLLAVSLYGGANGALGHAFQWLSFVLFLPVILFSAVPFYQSVWGSLKQRQLSIDIPVVFGILIGSIVSVVNLFRGDDRIYFDSLASLLFLLLSTRYLLKRTQQKAILASQQLHWLRPTHARKWNIERLRFELIRLDQVSVGDRLQILPNEPFPVDGKVLKGTSSIDTSILTGESAHVATNPQSIVFAGTLNLESPLEIEVTQAGTQTRVGRIIEATEKLISTKAKITVWTDQVARYFVAAVVVLSVATFLFGVGGSWHEAMNRALAISIVTCPCTFALITPLALSMTLGKLAQAGIWVKGADVLERLTEVKRIFLDKTGTLTYGSPKITHWDVSELFHSEILSLELKSTHPVGRAISQALNLRIHESTASLRNVKETPGFGIQGEFQRNGQWSLLQLNRAKTATVGTEVSVFWNEQKVGRIVLSDEVRADSKQAIDEIIGLGMQPHILSGDQRFPVLKVAEHLGIAEKFCVSGASPELKANLMKDYPLSIMVGDGANDSMALAQSHVGIAVQGGMEMSLRAADIYLGRPGVRPIAAMLVVARETLHVIHRNLWLSILYNGIAGGFALAGKINPLFAALLMPASAITVLLSSMAGTPQLKKALKELSV